MRPVTLNPDNPRECFRELERASHEGDLTEIAQNYTLSGTLTPTRTLNLTSPTAANIAAVLGTFISDLKKGGSNRTT